MVNILLDVRDLWILSVSKFSNIIRGRTVSGRLIMYYRVVRRLTSRRFRWMGFWSSCYCYYIIIYTSGTTTHFKCYLEGGVGGTNSNNNNNNLIYTFSAPFKIYIVFLIVSFDVKIKKKINKNVNFTPSSLSMCIYHSTFS